MYQKTDPGKEIKSFISLKLLMQLCVITMLILVILVALERIAIPGMSKRANVSIDSPLVYPWITVGSTTLRYALRGLDVPLPSIPSAKLYLLAGMLLTFVICPTIVLFGWRGRRLERQHDGSHDRPPLTNLSSIGYGLCCVVVSFVAITILPVTAVQMVTSKSRCESEEARLLRYETVNELNLVISNVRQYRLLPREVGGGEGTYAGYKLPERLARTEKAEYTVEVKPDTVLVKAESALCATNTIRANVGPKGLRGFLMYEGDWGYG